MSAVFNEEGPDKGAVWHFGEPNKEQKALEAGKAWADLSHLPALAITGADRLTWLHALTTQHLEKLQPGDWQSALILDPQGHIEEQFVLVDDGETTWLFTESARVSILEKYLNSMKFMLRVEVRDASEEVALLRAPGIENEIGGPFALVPRAELAQMIETFNTTSMQVGSWALDAIRVAAGRPRLGFDTDAKAIPNELGMLNKSVHMKKGCYRGQETVAKIANLGKPPRRLTMLHLDGSGVTLPNPNSPIIYNEKEVGYLGTVARHFELGTIALAVIKRAIPVDAILTVDGIPASQELIVSAE